MRRPLPLLLLAAASAHAQSTEAGLKARLLHKPLYLRQPWAADKLHFDRSGALVGSSPLASFTLSGLDIESIKLKGGSLELSGFRMGLEFTNQQPHRVVLQERNRFGRDTHDEEIKLTLDAPPGGDYTAALDAIVAPTLADLIPQMPLEWQGYAAMNLLNQPPPAASVAHSQPLRRVGGGVTAPVQTNAPEPEFTGAARALRWSGKVLVYFQVGKDGQPSHLRLLNPLGLGLDEQSLLAVQKYRFTPAMQNGEPVAVELNVQVKFEIF